MRKKFKVLITRKIPQNAREILNKKCELEIFKKNEPISRNALKDLILDKDGVICLLSEEIDKEIIDLAKNLRVISSYAVGYNNIDVEYATKKEIAVTNTPGVLTDATADLTWALLLGIVRRIAEGDRMIRTTGFKGWGPLLLLGGDLYGKTLGVVGAGRIGTAVAKRSIGWSMKILYFDRNRNSELEKKYNAQKVDLDTLITESDFVSIHLPLSQETHHLFNRKTLRQMKSTAFLVNTARGPIIEEKALIMALKEKWIAGAGLDVYEFEPKVSQELTKMDNVVLLPHIGSATKSTREEMARIAATNLLAVLEGNQPIAVVNPEVLNQK
jgi:glyoxylate reductase